MTSALLPQNSTLWERAVADAQYPTDTISSGIAAMRRVKFVSPRASMLPFLVWEYGLGELTPYVPNLYDLIQQGVRWQRLRGTVSAVAIGLAWVGYTATLEEAWPGRRWWNSFQLRFSALPANDAPDLERIEGVTRLSVPKRSQLRRGVYQYDVGALIADGSRLDNSMLDVESGIAVTQAGTLWSFGRTHENEVQLTQAEGEAAGYWIDPDWYATPGLSPRWVYVTAPWVDANFKWSADQSTVRERLMASWFDNRPVWMRLARSDGTTIGYRRARAVRRVEAAVDGVYTIAGAQLAVSDEGRVVYVEAMTQFDDAQDVVAASASLIVGADVVGVPVGRQWLEPDELDGGTEIALCEISVPLRRTVRDQFKWLLRFDVEAIQPVAPDDDFGLTALTQPAFWMED